ncbi:MAG: hypothetical protein J6D21_04415 [Clostridia bacterium]|nr:hypothetical protein [Clostridia bacterium]
MKSMYMKRSLCCILAVVLLAGGLLALWPSLRSFALGDDSGETETPEIRWNFERGVLDPFRVTEGEFGVGLIASWINERNYPNGTINKEGNYYLSTVETDTTKVVNEAYTGVITSPAFYMLDPTVTLKLGGGTSPNNYVAIVRASDGEELARTSLSALPTYEYEGTTYASGHMFTDVSLIVPEEEYTAGMAVYLKIVDGTTSSWGFITVDDIRCKGMVADLYIPDEYTTIHWSFEDGTMAPFTTKDDFILPNICDDEVCWNGTGKSMNKDGTYYMSTIGSHGTLHGTHISEAKTGEFVSTEFVLDPQNPTVSFRIAGGASANNYVAICRAADGEILTKISPTVQSGTYHPLVAVSLTVENYQAGTPLVIKVVDGTTAGWGFLHVDDFRFAGAIPKVEYSYDDVVWSFEDGTMAPFTTQDNFILPNICDDEVCWNGTGEAMNKDGTYYMSTIGSHGSLHGTHISEANTGEFVSTEFVLDPQNPTVSFRIGGGTSANNYVAICRATDGEILTKISRPAKSGSYHPLTEVSLTVDNYQEGTPLVIKVVDGTTAGWGFLHVDDFRFSGAFPQSEYSYADVIWSFENGTILPFTTEATFGGGLLSTYGTIPHGSYYLNTVQEVPNAGSPYNETYTGEFLSPRFLLDPEAPFITLSVNGGKNGNYVAVCKAETEEELCRVQANDSWTFVERTMDLTGLFIPGEELILKVVDGTTGGWAWIGVDNIRACIAMPPQKTLNTLAQVEKATGWNEEAFGTLTEMVQQNVLSYTVAEYPKGTEFLAELAKMQTRQKEMASDGVADDSPLLEEWIADMAALQMEIQVATPALGDGLLIFTVHHQYRVDHHNTHNMFPAYNGEFSDKAGYTPGGAVRMLNLKTGELITLLEDSDGLFRDLDVSHDGNRILLSYREDRNSTYNIVEYTLSDDRSSIVSTKQLTSLSTADDMDPLYMPSGDIVFSSTRDPKYVMCNRHIAANIYRMESDGANIVKITSSTLYERPTDVLPDGRILYDRWEYNDRDFGSAQGLWTVYADGTKQDTYYGNNSPTGAAIEGKVIPGTQMVMATLSSTHDVSWGALAIIDRSKGVDGKAPVVMTWPANVKDNIGDPGKAGNNIDAYLSLSVKYEDAQPLNDRYFLASRTIPGKGTKMGIYLLDIYGNETLLYEDDTAMSCFDATILASHEEEFVTADRRNYQDGVGTFFVQDVYEGTHMAGVERGTVTTLRIVESMDKKYISQYQQWNGEGQQNPGVNWHSFEVKRVIGEVPVYADGSAYFEVPQDVFVYFQLLDKDGRMIQSMRSGTLVQSGEKTGCVGCHEDRRTTPSTATGQDTPMALKANVEVIPNPDYVEGSNLPRTIAINTPDVPQKRIIDLETGTDKLVDWNDPAYFDEYTDLPTMNFLTEVQPIFTKNCLSCHGYDDPAANLSLVPDKDVIFNAAYINLWVNRSKSGVQFGNLVGAIGGGGSAFYNAKSWGSYNSPLVKMVYDDTTHSALLTEAERRKIAEWVDLNGTYYGDYSTNYGFNPGGRSPITADERATIGDTRTLAWNSLTHATLDSMIYFDNPEKSPILKNKQGTEYETALAIIQAGLERLRTNPDVDWAGLSAVPGNPQLSINPYRQSAMDAWRTEKVALYDAMEKANRAAIANGTKLYDSDHEAVMAQHNALWPGWPTLQNPGYYYTELPEDDQ